jgi:hypothetical protein
MAAPKLSYNMYFIHTNNSFLHIAFKVSGPTMCFSPCYSISHYFSSFLLLQCDVNSEKIDTELILAGRLLS